LYTKKRRFSGTNRGNGALKALRKPFLANLGARKTAVALNSHLAAAQKVGHCRRGFLGVLRARAHSKNKVAQGRSLTRSEDLIVLFHRGCAAFGSNMDAMKVLWFQRWGNFRVAADIAVKNPQNLLH